MVGKERRRHFFANHLHRQIFYLFFIVTLVPTVIATILNYCFLVDVVAEKLSAPEAKPYEITSALDTVTTTLFIATPVITFLILLFVHRMVHKIVGPFNRIIQELDKRIEGADWDHIKLRRGDKFEPLVERINLLIDKCRG